MTVRQSLAIFAFCRLHITEMPSSRYLIFATIFLHSNTIIKFVCFEVLRPSQHNGVMSSAVSLPNHTFSRQA